MLGPCPRCSAADDVVPLAAGAGALGEAVCGRCGGRLLEEAAAQRVIVDELGIARETLRELAGHFGRPSLGCASCGQKMHPIRLRGVPLDLCTGCGGVWLDAGELARLSEGRWAEVAGPAPPEAPGEADPATREPPDPAPATTAGYAVLLDDDQADATRMVAAFASARFRTAQDARTAAQRGHGVVAERIPAEDAARLVAALAAEGLPARVADAALLELPPAVRTKQLTFDDGGMMLADALGRPLTVPWAWVRAAAIGMVRMSDTETKLVSPEPGETTPYGSQMGVAVPVAQRVRTVIVEKDDVVLDLLVEGERGGHGRYRATRGGMIFRHRAGQSKDTDFRALARDLLLRLPEPVALTRGARALRDQDASWLRFRAVRDFELSLRWAWARARPHDRSST